MRSDWGLAIAIVVHRSPVEEDERLEKILNSDSGIPVEKARHGMPIRAGRAVVCPADVHLVAHRDRYMLTTAPRENHSRPSIDVTFRSVAEQFGERGGAVVLSGLLDDGAAGIAAVRQSGGLTIVQDPDEALYSDMPRSAVAAGAAVVARLRDIPGHLEAFALQFAGGRPRVRPLPSRELQLTRFTCPDCNCVLAEQRDGELRVYRCRVGHAFSPETLHAEKDASIEAALWTAAQILEEQADLTERAAARARNTGRAAIADRMAERAHRYRRRSEVVRSALPNVDDAIENSELRDAMN